MQGLQHVAIAAQRHDAIGIFGRCGAVPPCQFFESFAGFGRIRGDEGDRLVFHAGFIALTLQEIAYIEGNPFGNA